AWMGATHFLTRTLDKVRTEMSLHVLAYNLKRMIRIFGVAPLIASLRPHAPIDQRASRPSWPGDTASPALHDTFFHSLGRTQRFGRGPANDRNRRYLAVRARVGEGQESTLLSHSGRGRESTALRPPADI
ncbi:MAG: hypothetical protein WA633_15165, partial [Stellaceae bacterium]